MTDRTPPPTVSALPDIGASPTEPKKQKLLHVDSADPSASTPPMSTISTEFAGENDASGSKSSPMKMDDTDGSTSPVVMAVSLPTDEGLDEKEEWWELRMTWSGKVYDMTVGSNDM